jgi:hypothetical protein
MFHEAINSPGTTSSRRVEGEKVPHLAGVVVGWGCDRRMHFFIE